MMMLNRDVFLFLAVFRWSFTLLCPPLVGASAGPPVSINETKLRIKEKKRRRTWRRGGWRPSSTLHASGYNRKQDFPFVTPLSSESLEDSCCSSSSSSSCLDPHSFFDNVNIDLPSGWGVQPHTCTKGQRPCGWKRMWSINLVFC